MLCGEGLVLRFTSSYGHTAWRGLFFGTRASAEKRFSVQRVPRRRPREARAAAGYLKNGLVHLVHRFSEQQDGVLTADRLEVGDLFRTGDQG